MRSSMCIPYLYPSSNSLWFTRPSRSPSKSSNSFRTSCWRRRQTQRTHNRRKNKVHVLQTIHLSRDTKTRKRTPAQKRHKATCFGGKIAVVPPPPHKPASRSSRRSNIDECPPSLVVSSPSRSNRSSNTPPGGGGVPPPSMFPRYLSPRPLPASPPMQQLTWAQVVIWLSSTGSPRAVSFTAANPPGV